MSKLWGDDLINDILATRKNNLLPINVSIQQNSLTARGSADDLLLCIKSWLQMMYVPWMTQVVRKERTGMWEKLEYCLSLVNEKHYL